MRREQLSDEVAAHLRTDIMSGNLRPGTFIRLDETAAALGVSITPVREALRTLRGEGMVQLEPHRGHLVVPLTRHDIEDIFWLQATIAKELAATAAEQITEAEIDELERLNDALAEAVDRHEPDEIASRGVHVPPSVQQVSRPHQAGVVPLTCRAIPAAGTSTRRVRSGAVSAVAGHREMIAALRRGDVDTAVRLTGGEFTDGAQRLIARLDETKLWG